METHKSWENSRKKYKNLETRAERKKRGQMSANSERELHVSSRNVTEHEAQEIELRRDLE